ncbi:MAG: trypsin-like peptidase domain-containing protein [Planctomycetota bacterium]
MIRQDGNNDEGRDETVADDGPSSGTMRQDDGVVGVPRPTTEFPQVTALRIKATTPLLPNARLDSGDEKPAQASDRVGSPLADPRNRRSTPTNSPTRSQVSRSPNPLVQSVVLLATMTSMLLLARFLVPTVVEEIRYAWHRGQLRAEYEVGGEGLRNVSLDSISQAYQMVTSTVGPSVVHIDVGHTRVAKESSSLKDLFGVPDRRPLGFSDQGSGVIVDDEGYVLTNLHVIRRESGGVASELRVTLSDGRRVEAMVVGSDSLTDLAVLKVNASSLLPIEWGDSESLKVGAPVWAVGSPFGLDRTVTFGILSGKHRLVPAGVRNGSRTGYQDFMQSDVAVNPGNSGGPLVDARGTLVGINTAIVGDTYQGVSFSIPSNVARKIYERIRETGSVARGWLGVRLAEVPDHMLPSDDRRVRGALVDEVTDKQSPAAVAGLVTGDVIVSLNQVFVNNHSHLMRLIGDEPPGSTIEVEVLRAGDTLKLDVVLGKRPEILSR